MLWWRERWAENAKLLIYLWFRKKDNRIQTSKMSFLRRVHYLRDRVRSLVILGGFRAEPLLLERSKLCWLKHFFRLSRWPASGLVTSTSDPDKARWRIQDTMKGICLSAGQKCLRLPWAGAWGKGSLRVCVTPEVNTRKLQEYWLHKL